MVASSLRTVSLLLILAGVGLMLIFGSPTVGFGALGLAVVLFLVAANQKPAPPAEPVHATSQATLAMVALSAGIVGAAFGLLFVLMWTFEVGDFRAIGALAAALFAIAGALAPVRWAALGAVGTIGILIVGGLAYSASQVDCTGNIECGEDGFVAVLVGVGFLVFLAATAVGLLLSGPIWRALRTRSSHPPSP